MKTFLSLALLLSLSTAPSPPVRSGMIGVYGIVERVTFEPSEQAPERVQLWGAFAMVDRGFVIAARPDENGFGPYSAPARGYLYFVLPPGDSATLRRVRAEWADLKSVAGTGQAVAFGQFGYAGLFANLRSDGLGERPTWMPEMSPVRVRYDTERPAGPAAYNTNVGIVKLTASSHGEVINALRAALKK